MKEYDEARQKAIEILVKPLKVPYQQDAAEMMVQGAITQAEDILNLKGDGWRMAIVKVEEGKFKSEPKAHYRFSRIIWQAG